MTAPPSHRGSRQTSRRMGLPKGCDRLWRTAFSRADRLRLPLVTRPANPRKSWSTLPRRIGRQQRSRLSQRTRVLLHRSEEHTSELQSLMRISYAVFCLKKNTTVQDDIIHLTPTQIQS